MNEQADRERTMQQLDPLAQLRVQEEDELRGERRRNKIVSNLRPLVRGGRPDHLRKWRVLAGATTACAAAAALLFWFRTPAPETNSAASISTPLTLSVDGTAAEVTHASGVALIEAGERSQLDGVERVSTPSGSTTRIEVSTESPQAGLRVVAGPDSDITISPSSQNAGLELLHLNRGHVDVAIPQLRQGTTFAVVTPSIRAVVIGTAFSLTVNPDEDQDSCLRVSEGAVRVERAARPHKEIAQVKAGQEWGCREKIRLSGAQVKPNPTALRGKVPKLHSPQSSTPSTPPQASGTLAEETALLARAVRSNQQGKDAEAEHALNKLLREYPKSPLAAEARTLLAGIREEKAKQ